jgi:hypothetical protein
MWLLLVQVQVVFWTTTLILMSDEQKRKTGYKY